MDVKNYSTEDFICDESFQRYARGEAPADMLFWEAFGKDNPDKAADIAEAVNVITLLNGRQGHLQHQLDSLKDSVKRYDDLTYALPEKPVKNIPRASTAKYAAVAASLIILCGSAYLYFREAKALRLPASHIVFTSGSEPRKTIVLPDNSVVTLRRNSRLTLAPDFNTKNRELTLSGEGFFDVMHDSKQPFIVHTADANIEVLGTVFNVSAYPADHHTETSLFRGKVAITPNDHPDQKIILTPSKKIVINNGTHEIAPPLVLALDPDPVDHKAKEIAWVRNRLKIEDEPLSDIAAKLQSWYGISISFEDNEVKSYRYSGTFESETVLKALEALQLSYPFSFRVDKERIIIGK